jgi:hypothetical protein
MDFYAKQAIWDETGTQDTTTKGFPLEAICVFLGRDKLTLDKGDRLHFWAHKQLANWPRRASTKVRSFLRSLIR